MANEQQITLTAKQQAFLEALLESSSIKAAAAKLGVVTRTCYRWIEQDEPFKAAYREARQQATEHAAARLSECASRSVGVLDAIANDEVMPASARVAAASKIIDSVLKITEQTELRQQLDELEKALAAISGGEGRCD